MLILACLILLLNLIAAFAHGWLIENIGLISIDEVIFHLKVPLSGTSSDIAFGLVLNLGIIPILITAIVTIIVARLRANLRVTLFRKTFTVSLRKFISLLIIIVGGILLLGQYKSFDKDYGISEYVQAQSETSDFIEKHYVDPSSVSLTFPTEKRNLVYIYLESVESTFYSQQNGGLQAASLMPELEKLAKNNTNFSHTSTLGGALQVAATGWTMASIISQTAGIPLKLPMEDGNYCTNCDSFLSGAYSLGNILEKEGYNQMFMAGSDMTFGGRRSYLTAHGNYQIRDLYTAWEDGVVPEGRSVFWGFEDSYLFDYAKKELTVLAAEDKPFNFSLLTANTHYPDGYLEEGTCPLAYPDQYSSVIACSSRQLANFISWLQSQDFYANTTVIINGDHLTMAQNDILNEPEGYDRATANVILNAAIDDPTLEVEKNRRYTTMDLFPTTLAALGVQIPGDRLALGTNLYSGRPTLLEEYGIETMNEELMRRSDFYTMKLL